MARALRLPKFLKPTEKVTTPAPASLAVAAPTEDSPLSYQSKKSPVLRKGIKGTGKRIKQMFKRSKKAGYPLYLRENEVFCINVDDESTSVENESDFAGHAIQSTNNGGTRDTVSVEVRKVEQLGGTENVGNVEQISTVGKVVHLTTQETEVDDVQEHARDPEPMSTVLKAANSTAPLSVSGPFEIVNISPLSSLQIVGSDNTPSNGSVKSTSAPSLPAAIVAEQTTRFEQTSQTSVHDAPQNTTSGIEECKTPFFKSSDSYTRTPTASATYKASVEDGSDAYTHRADSTRALSDAATLMGSSSRDVLRLRSSAKFLWNLDDEHQLIADIQGQQGRRAVERDEIEEEERALGLDSDDQNSKGDHQTAFKDQSKEYEALLLKAKQDSEEQANTYEFLIAKAKQDGKDALEERKDEYEDDIKDLKKELENASKELEVVTYDLKDVTIKKLAAERQLKKLLTERTAVEAANKALAEKCEVQRRDITHRDEQILYMSSILQARQQDLEAVTKRYQVANNEAQEKARLVEKNGLTILDLRQAIQLLTSQLTQSGQHQQAPEAALIDNIRNENGRLLGILAEDHSLLEAAGAKISSLTQAVSLAKREHDRWTDDQLSAVPEDSLSDPRKIANHLAYKDKLYEDLEKRFQRYTAATEEQQKKAGEDKVEADKKVEALTRDLQTQKEAVKKAGKEKKRYQREMARVLTMTLGQMPQDEFVEGLSFHFGLVQKDNQALATRVAELDEEVTNLKQEVIGQEQEQENLVEEFRAHQKTTRQLEDVKKALEGELDALKYTSEVAEECHMEEVKKYETSVNTLLSDLITLGDKFSALNRESASERIQFILDSKDEYIHTLKLRLTDIHQALTQACNERDHYFRVTELDNSLAACNDRNVSFLQRQLRISEANYTELSANLDAGHLRRIREAREYKEAFEAEKLRVGGLEKQLHELYQDLHGQASHSASDTPPNATASQPAEDKSGAIEDLAIRLWERMRGLEHAFKALGRSIIEPDDEREVIRLASEKLLGLRDGDEFGSPQSRTSGRDAGEGDVGDNPPNGEDGDSHDNLGEEGADSQKAPQVDEQAHAQRIIDEACDALGYAPDDPRRVSEDMRGVEAADEVEEVEEMERLEETEGREDAAGFLSSTEAVLGEDDAHTNLEAGQEPEAEVDPVEAEQSSTDDDSGSTLTTDESESSHGGNKDDDRTVTRAEYNATAITTPDHATTTPQHGTAESNGGEAGQSPPSEGNPDDSLNMTPRTWATRYNPALMYGEPVEDDIF